MSKERVSEALIISNDVWNFGNICKIALNTEESRPEPPFGFVVSITPPDIEARPGENVRLRCDSSDRTAQIQWAKLSGVLPTSAVPSPDGQLIIYSISEGDSGVYACTGTTTAGQSTQAQARVSVSYAR